jgi:hypothetical protein
LRLRQGVGRWRAKRETRESLHMLPWVQRVWGHEPSHSQMSSHVGSWSLEWTSESLEGDCRGQNSWGVLCIIGKLLQRRCLKWARIAHLDICNISYGQKNGRESNWQFDSWPLKVGNRPDFRACRQRATYRWKALDEGYNFDLELIAIRGLHKKLYALKVTEVPTVGISKLPLGSPGTKSHLDVAPVERHRVYYKGEGGGFPQLRAMVSFVCPCYSWLVLAPKVFPLCTNHLVWVVCRPMWVSEACQLFLVPSRSSNTPPYPSKCCELGNVPRLFPLPLFSTWIYIWVLWGVGSASFPILIKKMKRQECFVRNQRNCEGCNIGCTQNFFCNHVFHFLKGFFALSFENRMLVHPEVDGCFWQIRQQMNHIIHATYTSLHTHRGGTTNLANNCARGRRQDNFIDNKNLGQVVARVNFIMNIRSKKHHFCTRHGPSVKHFESPNQKSF